jgi:hypothetical protein
VGFAACDRNGNHLLRLTAFHKAAIDEEILPEPFSGDRRIERVDDHARVMA